jgi:SAM-dependent methyltransferase
VSDGPAGPSGRHVRQSDAAGRARPAASPVSDELIARLNTWWRIGGPGGPDVSLKQRLASPLRRAIARFMGPQETFNSAVVQYVNATNSSQKDVINTILDSVDESVDQVLRQGEALAARERRIETALSALTSEHQEFRTSLGVLQQATRDMSKGVRGQGGEGAWESGGLHSEPGPEARALRPAESHALSHKYVGFEDQFRGSAEEIRERLAGYVAIFAGTSDVLDVGCGRGEFLALLREEGVSARGIDLNDSMVEVCREKGLEAEVADAVGHLRGVPDGSLGGLFAAQVVEHLEPAYLTTLLDLAFEKLRPGATIVLETINPACWFAFFESYIRDITHVRPLHPDTLRFLLVASGFQRVEIRYRVPYPEHEKLQAVPPIAALGDAVDTINANVEKINRLLFTHMDYAAIARRP